MFFTDVITALIVATLIMVPLYLTGRVGPWSGRIWFALVLFLFTWVGGVWGRPYGPVLWGVSWLPFVFFGLIFALLMAAAVPRRQPGRSKMSPQGRAGAENDMEIRLDVTIGIYFWLLLVGLVAALVVHYIK